MAVLFGLIYANMHLCKYVYRTEADRTRQDKVKCSEHAQQICIEKLFHSMFSFSISKTRRPVGLTAERAQSGQVAGFLYKSRTVTFHAINHTHTEQALLQLCVCRTPTPYKCTLSLKDAEL